MVNASIIALSSVCLAVFSGCAKKPVQAPLNYVVPVIGLPPIPVDTSRPGLDTRDLPSAETMAATQRTVRLAPDIVAGMRERRPVSMPYPAEARKQRLAGHVLFRVVIGTAGSIEGITLIETTNPIFVRTAAAAVESWQYRPYLANGKATAVDTTIRVDFIPPRQ